MYVRNKYVSRVNIIKCTINDFEYIPLFWPIYDLAPTILIKFVSKISHGVFYNFRYNPFSTKIAPSKCKFFDIETCKNTGFCKYARSLQRSNS